MCFEHRETRHNVLIFFDFERAGGINHPASRFQEFESLLDHFSLPAMESREVRGLKAPLDFRIPRQSPCARTGRIDQDAVECLGKRQRLGGIEDDALD